jgi:hypothetical protein
MAAIGGSILEVSLAGRIFAVAADAGAERDLGGWTNETPANGNGTSRLVKTARSWIISGVELQADDSQGDQEYVQELANSTDFFAISVTFASGITYQGSGQLVEEAKAASQTATMVVTLAGTGTLSAQ